MQTIQYYFGNSNVFPISLGYSCHVKVFIDTIFEKDRRPNPRLPFDWIGTPMWSICKLLEKSFDSFIDQDLIDKRRRFVNSKELYPTHKLYNIAFIHDIKKDMNPDSWKELQDNYNRRIERFYDILKTAKKMKKTIVFIRLEPDKRDRIEYPEFKQENDENFFLEMFSNKMNELGYSVFTIYFTTSYDTKYDSINNICYIKFGVKDKEAILSGDHIDAIFQANRSFIQTSLQSFLSKNESG